MIHACQSQTLNDQGQGPYTCIGKIARKAVVHTSTLYCVTLLHLLLFSISCGLF